jgi:quinol monooxygenase YgiN
MSEPVVFISHFTLGDGMREGFEQLASEIVPELEAGKPRTVGYLMYLDEDGRRLTIVHSFPDAAAMDAHFEGSAERSAAAAAFLTPAGWEIYGTPSEAALETMRQAAAGAGVPLEVRLGYLGGFLRTPSG